ncbi:hypothetical protein P3342_012806 [Pyrenophora teres f. teres]|nr:hypothetical protein P3342_012806 [Pyrenophora teres f. teres]
MSAVTSFSPPPPPPPNTKPSDTENSQVSTPTVKIPASGDGRSPETAVWSGALSSVLEVKETYVVDGIGLQPRYRRTTMDEARDFARLGYMILDGERYEMVAPAQIASGPLSNPSMPAVAAAIEAQMADVITQEGIIATGSGAATDAYNAAQLHHGDAFADSDDGDEASSSASSESDGGSSTT